MRSLAAACLALACCNAAALPARTEIGWEISRNGSVVAEAVDSFEHDGKSFSITSAWKGRGVLRLVGEARRASRGTIVGGALRTQEYEDVRTGRSAERASFDWKSNTLTWQYKGPAQSAPIPANAHDRLTQYYGFVFRAPEAGPFPVNVVDGKGIHAYAFKVGGRETVKTPAGEFETVRLEKVRNGPDERSVEIWLAVRRHNLPVRVLIVEKDGTRSDQTAVRIASP